MQEQSMAEDSKILEIVTGSHLYGTATPESDKDYVGVFMPSIEYVLGFKRCEEVDFSVKVKDDLGKNTKDAVDRKLYEFRKYIVLAMENNPNIIETLFVNKENIIHCDDRGKSLLDIRHKFLHRGLSKKFLGYAASQKHKMVIKRDNYFDFVQTLDFLHSIDDGKSILEVATDPKSKMKMRYDENSNTKFVVIGDLNIIPSKTVKSVRQIVKDRLDKVGNREELLTKFGYDCKFAGHLIRLMVEGMELLKTGDLQFPIKERKMLRDIREGKWSISRVLEYSFELEKEIECLVESSPLPAKPDFEFLQSYTIDKLKQHILSKDKRMFQEDSGVDIKACDFFRARNVEDLLRE